jgi:hypothetical protein
VARAGAVAFIAAAVLLTVAWALHGDRPPVAGSNGIRPAVFAGVIPAHGTVCENAGSASSAVDGVQVTVGAAGAGPQPLRLEVPGVGRGPVLRSYPDGVVTLRPPSGGSPSGRLACIRNLGRRVVHIAGEGAAPDQGALVQGRRSSFHVSFTLVAQRPASWWSEASSVLARVGLGRAGAGGRTTGVIVVLLLVASMLGALRLVWRWVL